MDFDHRPGTTKLGEISKKLYFLGEKKLLAEIAKCDLVCANCHRIRTQERKHWVIRQGGLAAPQSQ
jgi:hypothetical protein